ncbi:hypothetical protein [Sphingomonas bacterium]|uniref:hypothetical protein n=1 Tax=Sphingomonas bacterium TaxID=1895847 RepID=UPI0026177289|nr:hypothetical protein [Sphingomonas bacterium]MDB5677691.1 hypothetical protein [Sphingomonas bacterium]
MTKLAAIYERKGALFISASHQTKAGFWIDDEEVVTLIQPSAEELGGAVEAALARSTEGVPTPPPTARIERPLLKAAGVGSWATFMNLSRHVGISSEHGVVKLTPYRNLGSKGGFEPDTDMIIPAPMCSAMLGQMVADLLSRSG